jgi:alkylation response protein AidB-like acyl-CoA dehydrogenase
MDFRETAEQVMLREAVAKIAADYGHDYFAAKARAGEKTTELWQAVGEAGFVGVNLPEEYGGGGMGISELAIVTEELAAHGCPLLLLMVSPAICGTLLARFGTPAQRERWLPAIASGQVLASFSITEPQAGSDLQRIETTARAADDGQGLVLDGDKRWVAGGVSSDVIFLMASIEGDEKPSCVILPATGRETPTWRVTEIDKLGYRGVESAAYAFDHHHAPDAEILGGEAGAGARQMLDALDVGRVNVACRALGIVDRALACAVQESTGREIGDGVLGDHTHAQLRVGEIVARRAAVAALVTQAAEAVDARAEDARELSTAAKVSASDCAVWAVDRAARLAASRSFAAGDELARLRRDAPQTQIGEGANDALLMALAKGWL